MSTVLLLTFNLKIIVVFSIYSVITIDCTMRLTPLNGIRSIVPDVFYAYVFII